jgi:hypothetical protein
VTFKQASTAFAKSLALEHQALGMLLKCLREKTSDVTLRIVIDGAEKAFKDAADAKDACEQAGRSK